MENFNQDNKIYKQIGIIGLGKMGGNLARNLTAKNWKVIGYKKTATENSELSESGVEIKTEIAEFVQKLDVPRTIWLMVPHQAVDEVLNDLIPLLEKGDTVIDGGNSFYLDSVSRHKKMKAQEINFLDVGVSGGPEGALKNPCLMVGGDPEVYKNLEHLFFDLNDESETKYVGNPGAGHFIKMVHNGIEYGMMQAIGEGFEILKKSDYNLNLKNVAQIYSKDSVISSRLIDWLVQGYEKHGENLESETCCSPEIGHSGEGEWTVETAKKMKVKTPVIKAALKFRKKSKKNHTYTGKVVSALRHEFGGHESSPKIGNKQN